MEVVPESDGVLDKRERTGKTCCSPAKKQKTHSAVTNSEIGNAEEGADQEGESGVLLDEGRNGEEKPAGESDSPWEVS